MGVIQVFTGRELPREHPPQEGGARFDVHVIFTNPKGQRGTIEAAAALARDLGARITVVAALVVPYPLPLDEPPVDLVFATDVLREAASMREVEASVALYLCRDARQTILAALAPHSVVVIGAGTGWFSNQRHLAAALRREGHRVISIDPKT